MDQLEQEILKKIESQDKKLEEIHKSVESTRKYILWALIATVAFFILPLIGLAIAVPQLITTYSSLMDF